MEPMPQKDPNRKTYPPVTGIGRDEHVGMVREIFATITGRYDFLNRLLPGVARLFSGNPAAYRYLADSILHFPAPQAFLEMMEEAGFRDRERHSLTFGITCLYIGQRAEQGDG